MMPFRVRGILGYVFENDMKNHDRALTATFTVLKC